MPDDVPLPRTSRESLVVECMILSLQLTHEATAVANKTVSERVGSNQEIRALLLVHARPGIRPSVLAEALGVARSAASRTLHHLATEGLITRHLSSHDGRSVTVRLSRRGSAAVGDLERAVHIWLRANRADLERIIELYRAAAPDPGEAAEDRAAVPDAIGALAAVDEAARIFMPQAALRDALYSRATVSHSRSPILLSLYAERCQPRPTALAETLGWSKPRVTGALNELEAAGLIERRTGTTDDGRGVLVSLTDAGRALSTADIEIISGFLPQTVAAWVILRRAAESPVPREGADVADSA